MRKGQNIKGGLDQYGPEHFGRPIFATVRKSVGLKGLKQFGTLVFSHFSHFSFRSLLITFSFSVLLVLVLVLINELLIFSFLCIFISVLVNVNHTEQQCIKELTLSPLLQCGFR